MKKTTFSASLLLLSIVCMMSAFSGAYFTGINKNSSGFLKHTDSSFNFTPTYVNPQHGRPGSVTDVSFNVSCTPGKLNVYLPYFGEAYGGADILSGNPLSFTSSDFNYSIGQTKKGLKEIIITCTDNREVAEMRFTVYSNGTAYLDITMLHRSEISFTGNITGQ